MYKKFLSTSLTKSYERDIIFLIWKTEANSFGFSKIRIKSWYLAGEKKKKVIRC